MSCLVDIVLVNWNGWRHTVECLESLLGMEETGFRVIVYDNASTDGSVQRIVDWSSEAVEAPQPPAALARLLRWRRASKPVALRAWRGDASADQDSLVTVVAGRDNLGYAGAINKSLRIARAMGRAQYVWILNNDCVVHPASLRALVQAMQATPSMGICGSTVLLYGDRPRVQCLGGGTYDHWTGRTRGFTTTHERRSRPLEFVSGASMLVRWEVLDQVGLLRDDLFLYYEEIDLALRARSGFSLGHAPGSLVFHKSGAATGAGGAGIPDDPRIDFYYQRGRLLTAARHHAWTLPVTYMMAFVACLRRLVAGRGRHTVWIMRAMLAPTRKPPAHE